MTPQERLTALQALLELIDGEKNPSGATLDSWLKLKDALNPSPGQHHAKRKVTRGQIRGDVLALIEVVEKMI